MATDTALTLAERTHAAEANARASVPLTWPYAHDWQDVLAGNARARTVYAAELAPDEYPEPRRDERNDVRRARRRAAAIAARARQAAA